MRKKLFLKRKLMGYTQKSFSLELGISIRTYQNIEQGISFPRKRLCELIMKKLNESLNIFEDDENSIKRGDVSKNICNYMNESYKNMRGKTFVSLHLTIIRKSIKQESKDRAQCNLKINPWTKSGNELINERISDIANKMLADQLNKKIDSDSNIKRMKVNFFTKDDIRLFKICKNEEYQERTHKCSWGIPEVRKKLGFNPATGYEVLD